MSAAPAKGSAWSEQEKVALLLSMIRYAGHNTNWKTLPLPIGRTWGSSQKMYERLAKQGAGVVLVDPMCVGDEGSAGGSGSRSGNGSGPSAGATSTGKKTGSAAKAGGAKAGRGAGKVKKEADIASGDTESQSTTSKTVSKSKAKKTNTAAETASRGTKTGKSSFTPINGVAGKGTKKRADTSDLSDIEDNEGTSPLPPSKRIKLESAPDDLIQSADLHDDDDVDAEQEQDETAVKQDSTATGEE